MIHDNAISMPIAKAWSEQNKAMAWVGVYLGVVAWNLSVIYKGNSNG